MYYGPDSLVSVMTGSSGVDSYHKSRIFFSSLCSDQLWTPPSLLSNGHLRARFLGGVKRLGHDANHSSSISAEA
jgi:hypothetical protein